jgi:hypothetical protein
MMGAGEAVAYVLSGSFLHEKGFEPISYRFILQNACVTEGIICVFVEFIYRLPQLK